MNDTSEEGFLGRWSRRKRVGEQPARDEAATARPDSDGADPADPATEAQEEARQLQLAANREAAEAVDIEAITYESDLSVFFKEGVPALVKQAAMRKMWRSDPVFANVDGLNDYDQDFNVIDKVLTEFKSAWQVGRGYSVPEDVEGEPDGDPAGAGDTVADADAPEDGEIVADPPEGTTDPDRIDEADSEDDPVISDDAVTESAPGRLPEAATANLSENREPPEAETARAELPEDVRPTVSLRRRMAFFEDDPKT